MCVLQKLSGSLQQLDIHALMLPLVTARVYWPPSCLEAAPDLEPFQ